MSGEFFRNSNYDFLSSSFEQACREADKSRKRPNGNSGADAKVLDTLEIVCAADVTMRAIRWLWPNRFALGKIGIIGGLPDRGKGCITADMIARVTTGSEWPCREGVALNGNVLVLTAEDDLEDTIIPRLVAAGADMQRVHILKMVRTKAGKRQFSLVSDLALLEKTLQEVGGVVLIIIDPLSAYLGVNKVDTYRTSDVRGVLGPLKELVERHLTSIVGIMHFNKNVNVTSAMLRLADSLAFVAASRHVYVVVDEPQGCRRLLVKAKNNVAPADTKALAYNIESVIVGQDEETKESIVAPRIAWAPSHVDIGADEAMAAEAGNNKSDEPTAKDDAIAFLRITLAEGPRSVRELELEARDAGLVSGIQPISQCKPIRAARDDLGVKAYQQKGLKAGGWFWAMPHQMPSEVSDALQKERASDGVEGI
jgi:putative DNA primase/helicase